MEKEENKEAIQEIGKVLPRDISEEMKNSYIDYAMSVIVARALPDVRDGLKPVHRRILYTMYEDGLAHSAKFRKSANVVGGTLARYHPHGDMAVYDALVRLAQDFSMRYPLITGQGNFGSIDGDPPAAPRYTEAKMSKISDEIINDIHKDTVDFIDNYDGSRKEPKVLPALLPNLLLNGSVGIAVGMATNIPPHNLGEVCDAAMHLIDHPDATTEDLFEFVKGPDFPTGGIMFNLKEIIAAYSQGKGAILTRGKAEIEEKKNGWQILITEIPYQVQKSDLVTQIAKLIQDKKIDKIKDVRDESDRDGLRIVIELKTGAFPQKVLNLLYKSTDLQKNFHLNILALVDGIQPKVLSLSDVLTHYLAHRQEVVLRRCKHELLKAQERAHILEGLVKCLGNIDEVIKIIKKSQNREDARKNLMAKFKLTHIQAEAILETKLAALAKLEREKIEEELKQLEARIKELQILIKSPKKIQELVKKELKELKEKYQDPRRTKLMLRGVNEIKEEDTIPEEDTIITLTQKSYIKRIDPETYKTQNRGGKGIIGAETGEGDYVEHFVFANSHDQVLFFTDSGKVFGLPAYEIPKGTRTSKGRGLVNFLEITAEEKIMTIITLGKKDAEQGIQYLTMATKNGIVKRTALDKFKNLRSSGLIAINLKKGDDLRKVEKTTGNDQIILVTKNGMAIRFKEQEIRPMQRSSSGLIGMHLKSQDELVGMELAEAKPKGESKKTRTNLLVITENGYGKMTKVDQYRLQKRGGVGLKAAKITPKTGNLVGTRILEGTEDIMIISKKGQVIRILAKDISVLGRATQGVRLMRLDANDKVASLVYL
ncbi:MAG: DNA gyrase subunit A [Candidatus Pacebacteria bacterium]|nr:DNA gyrase subunit A [Candidatus Paceibacterota bacterium]